MGRAQGAVCNGTEGNAEDRGPPTAVAAALTQGKFQVGNGGPKKAFEGIPKYAGIGVHDAADSQFQSGDVEVSLMK